MDNNNYSIGRHYTIDVYNCEEGKIEFQPTIKTILNKIVDILQLTRISESYKQFEPVGVTGFILLEESHVSIHTWPEKQFAAIDVFSCRDYLNIDEIKNLLEKEFDSKNIEIKSIKRGTALAVEQSLNI